MYFAFPLIPKHLVLINKITKFTSAVSTSFILPKILSSIITVVILLFSSKDHTNLDCLAVTSNSLMFLSKLVIAILLGIYSLSNPLSYSTLYHKHLASNYLVICKLTVHWFIKVCLGWLSNCTLVYFMISWSIRAKCSTFYWQLWWNKVFLSYYWWFQFWF